MPVEYSADEAEYRQAFETMTQQSAADAVADVSSRAIDLCRALDNDPRIFPALFARWSYLRVASDVREAGALARDFLALAELKGTRADRMVSEAARTQHPPEIAIDDFARLTNPAL